MQRTRFSFRRIKLLNIATSRRKVWGKKSFKNSRKSRDGTTSGARSINVSRSFRSRLGAKYFKDPQDARWETPREERGGARLRYLQIFGVVHNLRAMHNSSRRRGHLNFGCWRTLTSSGTTVISSAACVFATGRATCRLRRESNPGNYQEFYRRRSQLPSSGRPTRRNLETNKSRIDRSFVHCLFHGEAKSQRSCSRRISFGSLRERFVVSQRRAFHDYQLELQFWKTCTLTFVWNETIPPALLLESNVVKRRRLLDFSFFFLFSPFFLFLVFQLELLPLQDNPT